MGRIPIKGRSNLAGSFGAAARPVAHDRLGPAVAASIAGAARCCAMRQEDPMSADGVGGAGGSSGVGDSKSTGSASEATAADPSESSSVDAAMSDVSEAEVAGAATSVTDDTDSYEAPTAQEAKEQQAAGLCVGTRDECEQQRADSLTEKEAIEALDGSFLHDPRSLSKSEVKGLEALAKEPHLSDRAREAIGQFLDDHRRGVGSLGINGQLGRPDAPAVIRDTFEL